MKASITPNTNHRVDELDLFRGFAILGIFMVNILVMNISFIYRGEWEAEQTGWWSKFSFFLLETIFYAKFFVIFSLLFGMGVMLQYQRMKLNGNFQLSFFLRRFTSLFLFGVAHILFIWSGDILHLYGLLGFSLMLFFKGSSRILLIASIIVFIIPFYGYLLDQIVASFNFNYMDPLASYSAEELVDLKHNGTYLSGIELRIKEFSFAMGIMYAGILPVSLSMMLFGGYLIKLDIFNDFSTFLQRIKFPLFIAIAVLLSYRFLMLYWIYPNLKLEHGSPLSITLTILFQASDIATSFGLLWVLGYFSVKGWFNIVFGYMRAVGKMAFTNYILQSVLGYLIMRTFNGYGTFSVTECIFLVLGIYLLQLVISKWWLNYFKFGPLEWFWRCISYWKWFTILK